MALSYLLSVRLDTALLCLREEICKVEWSEILKMDDDEDISGNI